MNKNSSIYTLIYSIIMVVIVASLLTFVTVGLSSKQEKNIELEKKSDILRAININSTFDNVESLYDKYILESFLVDRNGERVEGGAFAVSLKDEIRKDTFEQKLPVYIAKMENGSLKYVFTLNGKGLWGGIWGYISFNDNLNTIYGINLDHTSETPGLGAEISEESFINQFKGKQVFNEKDEFVSISITKKGSAGNIHAVDAVSGGTITSNGVRDMLRNCLSAYLGFIEIEKNKK